MRFRRTLASAALRHLILAALAVFSGAGVFVGIVHGEETGSGPSAGGDASSAQESFKSDLFTGAATLSVDITLPPGANGHQPRVALAYNSNSGPSWVGQGWNLEFGSIQRMTKFGTPRYDDDPNTGDFFQLGDDRLVRDDAGIYHTMRESFQRIERVSTTGAISHWIIHKTDGVTLWFGDPSNSALARIKDVEDPNNPKTFAWLLSRAEDSHGNFIVYEYATPSGSAGVAYPSRIAYGFSGDTVSGSPTLREVVFELDSVVRPDRMVALVGGVRRILAHRLRTIRVRYGGSLVGSYQLEYLGDAGTAAPANRRSLLRRVRRFGSDGATELPSDTYLYSGTVGPTWGSGSADRATELKSRLELLSGSGFDLQSGNWSLIDINGDAAVDVLRMSPANSLAVSEAWINHKGKVYVPFGSGGVLTVPHFDIFGSRHWWSSTPSPGAIRRSLPVYAIPIAFVPDPVSPNNGLVPARPNDPRSFWGDINGDGRVDVIFGRNNPGVGTYQSVWLNSGTDWVPQTLGKYASVPVSPENLKTACSPYRRYGVGRFADVNGDGRVDAINYSASDNVNLSCSAVGWADRSNYGIRDVFLNDVNDPNGFGAKSQAWSGAFSTAVDALNVTPMQILIFDVNGDGLPDLAPDTNSDGAVDGTVMMINTGRGWISSSILGLELPSGVPLRPADLDGDGMLDSLSSSGMVNTGSSFVSALLPSGFGAYDPNQTQADFDGDGRPDLISAVRPPNQVSVVTLLLSSEATPANHGPPGRLVGVDHALGATTRISYTATTETSCYNPSPIGEPPLGGCHALTAYASLPLSPGQYCEPPMIFDQVRNLCLFPVEQLPSRVYTVTEVTRDDRNGNACGCVMQWNQYRLHKYYCYRR